MKGSELSVLLIDRILCPSVIFLYNQGNTKQLRSPLSCSKVTPPPWRKVEGLMDPPPPLGFWYVTLFRKDFTLSKKPVTCSTRSGIYYGLHQVYIMGCIAMGCVPKLVWDFPRLCGLDTLIKFIYLYLSISIAVGCLWRHPRWQPSCLSSWI